jgi:hypothetical protein
MLYTCSSLWLSKVARASLFWLQNAQHIDKTSNSDNQWPTIYIRRIFYPLDMSYRIVLYLSEANDAFVVGLCLSALTV